MTSLASEFEGITSPLHVCSLYQSAIERRAVASAFVRVGLGRGAKCFYLYEEGEEDWMAEALAGDGVDVQPLMASGALVLKKKAQAYFQDQPFQPDSMLAFWQHEVALAASQGYRGVRGAGDTDWRPTGDLQAWLAYEVRLDDVLALCDCVLLSQYNRARHSTAVLLAVLKSHPLVFYDGVAYHNADFSPAAELASPDADEHAVQRWLRSARERVGSAVALRKATKRNARILDAITEMFFALDKDFRFTYMNQHAADRMRLLGKDPDRLIGGFVLDELADAPSADVLRRVMNERVPLTDEIYYAPLGQWFEDRVYPMNGGLVVFRCDVTERKRNEACLEAGQRISHTGSWVWNVANRSVSWSAELFHIMGLDRQSVKPTYELFFECVHADDRDIVRQAFEAAAKDWRDYAGDYRVVRPDGSIRHLHGEAQPVMDASGNLAEYIGTAIDITERKRSDEDLLKMRSELAHVNRALTVAELGTSIAHELNQPLAAIIANASACRRRLRMKPPNEPEARAALWRIARDANRATDVIARIRLLLARHEPQRGELAIAELISDVISIVASEARHKDIVLGAVVEKDLPLINADRVRIQQVLLNLLVNAIDALGSERGTRTIEVRAGRDDDDDVIRVRVKDSGPGMDAKNVDRVFEPFFSTKQKGTGMGLSISRSIIEEHGGRMRALNNADGPGATFEFTLPPCIPKPGAAVR